MWANPQFPGDFVKFAEEILQWKLHYFLGSVGGLIQDRLVFQATTNSAKTYI